MDKRSRRPSCNAHDIHSAIRAAAAQLAGSPFTGVLDAASFPELNALLDEASRAVEGGVPTAFVFHGRTYFLRARIAAQLDVFESDGAARPLISGVVFSRENVGHAPGH